MTETNLFGWVLASEGTRQLRLSLAWECRWSYLVPHYTRFLPGDAGLFVQGSQGSPLLKGPVGPARRLGAVAAQPPRRLPPSPPLSCHVVGEWSVLR